MKPKPKKPLDPSQPHLLCFSLLSSHSFTLSSLLFSPKPLFYPLIEPHLMASMTSTLRCSLCCFFFTPFLSSHICPDSLQGHLIGSFTTSAVKGPEFAAFMISLGGFARCSARLNVSSTIIGLVVPRSASFWSQRIRYYGYLDETNLRLQDTMFQNELLQRSVDCCDDTAAVQICDGGIVGTLILRISAIGWAPLCQALPLPLIFRSESVSTCLESPRRQHRCFKQRGRSVEKALCYGFLFVMSPMVFATLAKPR